MNPTFWHFPTFRHINCPKKDCHSNLSFNKKLSISLYKKGISMRRTRCKVIFSFTIEWMNSIQFKARSETHKIESNSLIKLSSILKHSSSLDSCFKTSCLHFLNFITTASLITIVYNFLAPSDLILNRMHLSPYKCHFLFYCWIVFALRFGFGRRKF